MDVAEYVKQAFPEAQEIKDEKLRQQTLDVWAEAMKRGGWESMDDVQFTLLIPNLTISLIDHTRQVTRQAMAVAGTRDDLNKDLVIACGLLHDVGKALEYKRNPDGSVSKSRNGELLRHPVSGAALALEMGLPEEVAHVIAAHSKEGEFVSRLPEAILVFHCDFIDFEIAKTKKW